jgi:hypothetical protein
MADPAELRQELEEATRNIVGAHARIARQNELLRTLAEDATEAEKLLHTMMEAVDAMKNHRRQIMRELAAQDEGESYARWPMYRCTSVFSGSAKAQRVSAAQAP